MQLLPWTFRGVAGSSSVCSRHLQRPPGRCSCPCSVFLGPPAAVTDPKAPLHGGNSRSAASSSDLLQVPPRTSASDPRDPPSIPRTSPLQPAPRTCHAPDPARAPHTTPIAPPPSTRPCCRVLLGPGCAAAASIGSAPRTNLLIYLQHSAVAASASDPHLAPALARGGRPLTRCATAPTASSSDRPTHHRTRPRHRHATSAAIHSSPRQGTCDFSRRRHGDS